MKVVIIKTNNSNDYLVTARSAMKHFKEADIQIKFYRYRKNFRV